MPFGRLNAQIGLSEDHNFINSFIPAISIAPLQVLYNSEVLPSPDYSTDTVSESHAETSFMSLILSPTSFLHASLNLSISILLCFFCYFLLLIFPPSYSLPPFLPSIGYILLSFHSLCFLPAFLPSLLSPFLLPRLHPYLLFFLPPFLRRFLLPFFPPFLSLSLLFFFLFLAVLSPSFLLYGHQFCAFTVGPHVLMF